MRKEKPVCFVCWEWMINGGNSIKGGTRVAEIGVVVTQRESPNNIIPANDEILFCCDCGIEK